MPEMADRTGSRPADASALEALVDAAAGILAADSLPDTLGRIAHHLGVLLEYDELSVYEVDRAQGCSSRCSRSAPTPTR